MWGYIVGQGVEMCKFFYLCDFVVCCGFGAVAQLGERYNGIVEVRGSTPLGSTTPLFDAVRRWKNDGKRAQKNL